MNKLKLLFNLKIIAFIYWNFFSRRVKRDRHCYIFPFKHSLVEIDKTSLLELHSNLFISFPEMKNSFGGAKIFMRNNGNLVINGDVVMKSGAMIQVQNGGMLNLGRASINHDATIIITCKSVMGDGLLISRKVTIFDSDFHRILDKSGNVQNTPRPIHIGNHVWIGVNCTILRGSDIEDGAVIAAGSIVGGKIKSGTMASGNPARSYSEIIWEE